MASFKDDFSLLSAKLRANSRFDLYDKNYLSQTKWIFPLLLCLAFISLSVLFSMDLLSQFQLIVSSVCVMVILILVQLVVRKAKIAALKGDTLILKGVQSESTVTSIRSVQKASSFHLFGVQVTHLYYTLDHQKRSSLLFGAPLGMKTSLDKLIRHAKKQEKK